MVDNRSANRLLVVDDEPGFGRLVKRVAEPLGFEVAIVEYPANCARAARSLRPNVLLLDLQMPELDGVELLRILAADKYAGHLVVTSGADAKILETAMQLGRERGLEMSGMLHKPARIEALRQLLTRIKSVPRALLTDDLAEAIEANHLFLEYQPKLDCRLGRITGVEALVRWRHPKHGIIMPEEFIGLAEEDDLIHRVTDWVVAAAARQAAQWRSDQLALDVAINISARDVEDLKLPERVRQHFDNAGADPASTILELTETSALREAVPMMDVLTRLRLKGFKLSIDDFGAGYSSLVQLQRLPFSEIKIDRSFVIPMMRSKSCEAIVEIVIDLARKLGLQSVAEGVEEQAALDRLVEMGCNVVQGFHLARAMPAEAVAGFVRRHQGAAAMPAA